MDTELLNTLRHFIGVLRAIEFKPIDESLTQVFSFHFVKIFSTEFR
jgi:hypothetical protein